MGLAQPPYILSHCVYVFTLAASRILKFAEPSVSEQVFVLQLRNMICNGHPAKLHPQHGRLRRYPAEEFYKAMPHESWGCEITMASDTPAGETAYGLVSEFYSWLGFDRSQVPDGREENGRWLIDEQSLFAEASR